MDMQRFKRWVGASHGLAQVEVFMVPLLQNLGRMDCQLQAGDQRFLRLPQEEQNTIEETLRLNDQMTHSYLWVLGAYEISRTLHQRLRGHPLEGEVQRVKQNVNRLRIPLAKMEAAGRSPEDSPIAYPALNTTLGTSWQLTATEFISRIELADQLLIFLENFAAPQQFRT